MHRLPLGDLEVARRDPIAYRDRLDSEEKRRFGLTYSSALRWAVFRFHATGDDVGAAAYLEELLEHPKLRNAARKEETAEEFQWYVQEYAQRAWPTFETRRRLVVPLPRRIRDDLTCSGEIARIDLEPSGGYAAWLFMSSVPESWITELRWPLIQGTLAESVLAVSPDEVRVGLYAFKDRIVVDTRFDAAAIRRASARLRRLVRKLGF